MAARKLKPRHQDEIRQKIQASQLINRLTDHALGKVEMSATQVRAVEILLKKSIPDLTQVTGSGDNGEHELVVEIIRYGKDQAA
jgi:hypothetical protein